MKKLKLDLNELRIESFDPSPTGVVGHSKYTLTVNCGSCNIQCNTDQNTCRCNNDSAIVTQCVSCDNTQCQASVCANTFCACGDPTQGFSCGGGCDTFTQTQ